mmetsp:Transcript_78441/g.204478  ORF Transcript_78441/g.204478 Transcript_78441/m.204478 type:complete len:226 (+) Transcript_78441:554-1231(+)
MRTAWRGTQRWRTCWHTAAATCCASRPAASRLTCRSSKALWSASRAPRFSACTTSPCRPSTCPRALRCTATSRRRTLRQPTRWPALASQRPIGGCWPLTPCRACVWTSPARPSSGSATCGTSTCSTGSRSSTATAPASRTKRSSWSQRRSSPSRGSTQRQPSTSAAPNSSTPPWRCTQSCGSGTRPSIGRSRAKRPVPRCPSGSARLLAAAPKVRARARTRSRRA